MSPPPGHSLDTDGGKHASTRSGAFHPSHRPFIHDTALRLDHDRVSGPLSFLNPTRAHFHHESRPDVAFKWTSRNNRKGRHAIVVAPNQHAVEPKHATPRSTASLPSVARGIWRMLTYYPVWDISFDVAFIFTIGSVVWVINAFFVWLPLQRPDTEFATEELYGGGITAFVGATIFVVGSFLLMAEAVNENRSACFGWALESALSHEVSGKNGVGLLPSTATCTHHHIDKSHIIGNSNSNTTSHKTELKDPSSQPNVDAPKSWTWWPSHQELTTHYLHSFSFLASLAQLIGACIFWVAGLTALPGIYNHMSRPITIIFYWTPQVVGGCGFIISGTLFMLETQSKWWKPAFGTLGWWIGAWNLIGGIGFTVSPAFGYDQRSWAQYQACLSTFWASWAFLIGSVVQWYESLEKFPVGVGKV